MQKTKSESARYVGDLVKLIADPYGKSVSGVMRAPSSASASIFIAEGAGTITCETTTKSAVAFYDPQASLRKGQSSVIIMERNASKVVTKVSAVNVGRPSNDYLAAGLIASSLTCQNTSASDEIAGSQTQATLISVPKDIASINSTDVLQFATDKTKDVVANVSSKSDFTRTHDIPDHQGDRMALLREGAISNKALIKKVLSAASATEKGFIAISTDLTVRQSAYYANIGDAIFDSKRVSDISPFSLATYSADIDANIALVSSGQLTGDGLFVAVAFDAAGTVLKEQQISANLELGTTGLDYDLTFSVHFESTTVPPCTLR